MSRKFCARMLESLRVERKRCQLSPLLGLAVFWYYFGDSYEGHFLSGGMNLCKL